MTRMAWCIRTVCTRAPTDWPKDASERKRLSIDATCCERPTREVRKCHLRTSDAVPYSITYAERVHDASCYERIGTRNGHKVAPSGARASGIEALREVVEAT